MAAALLRVVLLAAFCGAACAARSPSFAGTLLEQLRPGALRSRVASDGDSADPHEVLSVPGYDGVLPSKHYAGYITVDADHGRQLFYYLVTSERSERDVNDPVVLWFNGGPGCSSFDGFVYEHGPFLFANAPAGGAALTRNPNAWSTVAHVVYVDSPAGVGLSYSDTRADYTTNDTATARDADAFLRAFMVRYPQLADNELYIAGESYAGIYVPNLARSVLHGNDAGVQPTLNLVGYMVGNGCTDAEFDGNALVPYAVGKSLISVEQAAEAARACRGQFWNASEGACAAALDAVDETLRGLNLYDTLDDCVGRGDLGALPLPTVGRAWPLRATLPPAGERVENWATLGVTIPCMDTSLAAAWLNSPAVREALHAAPVMHTGPFAMCSNAIRYTHDAGSMLPVHAELLRAGVRALIYSGDHDSTEAWTSSLGLPVEEEWRAWRTGGQVAGYTRSFVGGLTYATVKGAGHTVPTYKPAQSLAMLSRFLAQKKL